MFVIIGKKLLNDKSLRIYRKYSKNCKIFDLAYSYSKIVKQESHIFLDINGFLSKSKISDFYGIETAKYH